MDREEIAEVKAYRAAVVQLDSKPDPVEGSAAAGTTWILLCFQLCKRLTQAMRKWRRLSDEHLLSARQKVRQYVKLIVDSGRAEVINEQLKESTPGSVNTSVLILVVFDVKNSSWNGSYKGCVRFRAWGCRAWA